MILGTGSSRGQGAGGGFTLIEILLVIALIAVSASVVMINFIALAERGEQASPEEVLNQAIRRARFVAAADRITTKLRYDEENGSLRIEPGGEVFPINDDFGPNGGGEIRFFLIPPTQGLSTFPSAGSSDLRAAFVAFAADRSSSPFIAEIDPGQGSPVRLRYDPFSSVILTEE